MEKPNLSFAITQDELEKYLDECNSKRIYTAGAVKETGLYTRLGYWHDRKGENEINIIAEDEVDNKIEFIEVKRKTLTKMYVYAE